MHDKRRNNIFRTRKKLNIIFHIKFVYTDSLIEIAINIFFRISLNDVMCKRN